MIGTSLILSALLLVALFTATWLLSIRLSNWSLVDVTWSFAFAPVAALHACFGHGWILRRILIALLITTWSLRLGGYLWKRVAAHHPEVDPRYRVLQEKWAGASEKKNFYVFFMVQALLVWLLMLPVALVSSNPATAFSWLEMAGAALWFIALIGEGVADSQLRRFKRDHLSDPGSICTRGLWGYSRHPNYFFQSLLWWGLFLMALPADHGWLAILAPLAMLHFILNVTGIPLTEKLSLEKRGKAWLQYQHATSAFIPLPPKKPTLP